MSERKTQATEELFECPFSDCNGDVSRIPYTREMLCDKDAAHYWVTIDDTNND